MTIDDFDSNEEWKSYQIGRADAVDECIRAVKDYFIKLIEQHDEWGIDEIDKFALVPNKDIIDAMQKLK